jgi:IS4 transposase
VRALTIAELYRSRWQIELFFPWIKQHLRTKAFFGTSPNAARPAPLTVTRLRLSSHCL